MSAALVRAGVLDVAVERSGDRDGWPVVLLHGFPYDPRAYDDVVPRLADEGADVVVPYLRGYGATRFADPGTLRSGQQGALGHDLAHLIAALKLDRPLVAGFDWGGRAACVVAAVWPELVSGLVSVNGYNVHDLAGSGEPAEPEYEQRFWYQYYLHGDRGVAGLRAYRRQYARLLWRQWSPTWSFTDTTFDDTAASFDNPDFVEVVVHSYRHRYRLAAGDPTYQDTEDTLAAQPAITVPTIVLDAEHDTVEPPQPRSEHEQHFVDLVDHRVLGAGHNGPAEAPHDFARAVTDLHDTTA